MADLHAVFQRFIEEAIGKHPVLAAIRRRLDAIENAPGLEQISDRVEVLEAAYNVGPQLKQSIASHLHELLLGMITSSEAGAEATEERVEEVEELVEEAEEFAADQVAQADDEIANPPEYVTPSEEESPPPLGERTPPPPPTDWVQG